MRPRRWFASAAAAAGALMLTGCSLAGPASTPDTGSDSQPNTIAPFDVTSPAPGVTAQEYALAAEDLAKPLYELIPLTSDSANYIQYQDRVARTISTWIQRHPNLFPAATPYPAPSLSNPLVVAVAFNSPSPLCLWLAQDRYELQDQTCDSLYMDKFQAALPVFEDPEVEP